MKCVIFAALLIAVASADISCSGMCTQAQCRLAGCSLADKYACVAGHATGGCSSTPGKWENTTQCTACCDISSCVISCPACNATQCAHSPCTATDPYMCTSGIDANGCAANASSWARNLGCHSCCDISACPTPPPSTSCNKSCGDLCHSSKRCPVSTPFMCSAGTDKYGCSNTANTWNAPGCSDCCDVNLCPKPTCGACSATVCNTTQCSQTNPYICTGGRLNGGCSPSKNYWPDSPDCTSCCDFNKCH